MRRAAVVAATCLGALLSGCGLFFPDKNMPEPKELVPVKPTIAGRVVWMSSTADVEFPLSVAVNGSTFTVGASDGSVIALDSGKGREVWRGNAKSALSAGVGSDGKFAAVVTREGQVVVFEGGRELWRQPAGTRVITAPLVAGERVFVVGLDRSVTAFDALNGARLWSVQRPGDPLTLAQAGVAMAFKNTLLVSQGSRLAALDPANGATRWDVALATPRGANEIERLADLVGPAVRVGDVVCVRAYQASVGCVNAETGQLLWTKNFSGRGGLAADEHYVYAADAADRITAWKADTGEVVWTTDAYLHRQLTTPFSLGPVLVFGDFEGQLHFVSSDHGVAQLILPTDGAPMAAAPVVSGTTVLIVSRDGGLFALRPE
ncbi:MAG: outer membrane protein assembly factor BamB [Burkholderiales bacterium]